MPTGAGSSEAQAAGAGDTAGGPGVSAEARPTTGRGKALSRRGWLRLGAASGAVGGAALLGGTAWRQHSARTRLVRWQEPAAGVDHPGIDRARLDPLGGSLAERGTNAFLVARGERLV